MVYFCNNWSDCVGTVQTLLSKGDTRKNDENFAKLSDLKAHLQFGAVNEKFHSISRNSANFVLDGKFPYAAINFCPCIYFKE